MTFELKGGPLSGICFFGLPYASYILVISGITLDALVELTILATGNLEARSCITTTCLEEDIGPKMSTATVCQHLDGTSWETIGSDVFFVEKAGQSKHVCKKLSTFLCIS